MLCTCIFIVFLWLALATYLGEQQNEKSGAASAQKVIICQDQGKSWYFLRDHECTADKFEVFYYHNWFVHKMERVLKKTQTAKSYIVAE